MSKNKKKYYGFARLKIAIIGFGLMLCVSYLCVINTGAVKGYEIKKVEQKIAQLKKENRQLQIEEAELNSFYNIKKEVGGLDMVEVKDIVYVSDDDQIVAFGR